MSAYMKNRFAFLGIGRPELKILERPFLAQLRKHPLDWSFVDACWGQEYREAQYVALDYLAVKLKELTSDDLPRLKQLITTKSWWETVDTIDAYVGHLVAQDSALEAEMLAWSQDDNLWLRRVAINHQLRFKEKTNVALLTKVIENNLGSDEFFINKAIGWSLREYSKTNPEWIRGFLSDHESELSPLSLKEARKYL